MKTTLSILVHGESKIGKSWFDGTAPMPRLIVDLEGRAKYLPDWDGGKTEWHFEKDPPPAYDGSWTTCVATVTSFRQLTYIYQWLRSGQHQFRSVVLDSLMEAQKRLKDQIAGTAQFDQQNWGELLRQLEAEVRNYRDLTMIASNPVEVVCLIVGTVDRDDAKRPLLEGALRTTVPYYLDVIGYMHKQPQEAGPARRALLVEAQPGFVAGDGTGKLNGPIIYEPNLTEMWSSLRVNGKAETVMPQAEQEVAVA